MQSWHQAAACCHQLQPSLSHLLQEGMAMAGADKKKTATRGLSSINSVATASRTSNCSPVLWAHHQVVLPCRGAEPKALGHHDDQRREDCTDDNQRSILHAGEDALYVENDEPECGCGNKKFDDAHVRDPPPLVGVDQTHRLPPAHIVNALCEVHEGEAVQAHQAEQTGYPERPEAVLLEVPPHPGPMVAVEVGARGCKDDVATSQDGKGKLRSFVLVDHGVEGCQGHHGPTARSVERHAVVLLQLGSVPPAEDSPWQVHRRCGPHLRNARRLVCDDANHLVEEEPDGQDGEHAVHVAPIDIVEGPLLNVAPSCGLPSPIDLRSCSSLD
mmetsp:Transcript_96008/g.215048  ORF Transcript_96008/g.215048 Transcript_96008/m.215048 type:complete len:329 (+) Transcript_96008:98-1084(+)